MALLAHGTAVVCGLVCLAVFGLWNHPSVVTQDHNTARQISAQALAVGATVFLPHVFDVPHPRPPPLRS
ncbi:hypothetical protein ABZ723_30325 [Streptomyces sp. NPDC006700]|uniref:hypothetical protein n=1 Tax=unclassified Streptomyces TaxID=2593676 RepID=UPI0033D7C78F